MAWYLVKHRDFTLQLYLNGTAHMFVRAEAETIQQATGLYW